MNEKETQLQNTSKKEHVKKIYQYTGTLLGSAALVAAGVLALTNPDKDPKDQQNLTKVSDEAPKIVPGTRFDMLKGTSLQLRPSPRRTESPAPQMDKSSVAAQPEHLTTEEIHTTPSHLHETTHNYHTTPNLGNDVVVRTPPTTETPTSTSETPSPTPIIVN